MPLGLASKELGCLDLNRPRLPMTENQDQSTYHLWGADKMCKEILLHLDLA